MKKMISVLLAIAVLFSAAAFADEPETDGETADISARVAAFFEAWNRNDPDGMLALCNSGWKAGVEDPRTELLNILGNRTPQDAKIEEAKEIAGEGPDGLTYYLVTVTAHLDGNDGASPEACSFRFLVRKEEDGLWYIGPTGPEFPEDESPAETAAAPEDDAGTGAADQSAIITFRDAVEAAGEYAAIGGDIDYLSVAASKNGSDYRTVTILDDRAKELYMAAMAAEDPEATFEAFDAYAWSLPVCYTERITEKPKEQEELDALAGKTVSEILEEEGYSFAGSGGGENLPTVVDLSFGVYTYEFEVDASFEEYLDHESRNDLGSLRVKSGRLASSMCINQNLDYLADGTYQPQVVPNYTAEELAAADNVPPAEEYTMKAWPMTAESYSDLQNNLDARYGQVYMVEGVVYQVLSQDPMRVIIYTGEDGKSQPVVVESPEQRRFKWEEGKTYRIYADVTSALFILPVLTARYSYTGLPADQAGEADLPEEAASADSSEESRLIGLLVTREDLTKYTDETGVILASVTREGPDADPEFTFGDISGLQVICFIAPEDDGEDSRVVSSVDDGISAVNFDLNEDGSSIKMDATISFVPGRDETLFFCNPVFRTGSGQVFAVPGDFMAVSAAMNPPGSSVGQAVQDERKHTENGSVTVDTTTAGIQIETVPEPVEIRLLQFSEAHELLKSEAFEPGTVPGQIVPLEEADYLLLETVEKDLEGGLFTRREVIGRDVDFLNTLSCQDDGICLSHYHEVLWADESVRDTVEGNMKTYLEMADGTWMCDGYPYQYRLEIKGRMPNAAADSTFVYLSNIEEISFEKAYMAAGLSSNQDDYFSPEEAVLVEMN